MTAAQPPDAGVDLYLDLLARALTGALSEDSDRIAGLPTPGPPDPRWLRWLDRLAPALHRAKVEVAVKRPYDAAVREAGRDWPARSETMAGLRRLANARLCVEQVLADGVPGDIVETGVWRGGMSIFMRGVLKAHGVTDRKVWLADSFRGLPPPDAERYPADRGLDLSSWKILSVSVEEVRHNFARYGLLDDQVGFLVGWFRDTLPGAPMEQLSVLRLDGDLYESTVQALDALYPRLSPGGYCIVDDYGAVEGCRVAVTDYRSAHGIADDILPVDATGVYWRKSG